MSRRKIVVAITGASGSIYAKVLLDKLQQLSEQIEAVGIVMSDNAKDVWKFELDNDSYKDYDFPTYQKGDFMARSEEHTSELQSRENLVCRLLLEKKKK